MCGAVTVVEEERFDATGVGSSLSRLASLSIHQHEAPRSSSTCPNVVTFYDAYVANEQIALVVEYMNGGSLQDLVDRGGCSDEDFLASIAIGVRMCCCFCLV
jgi:serine/threonine protein kinase